MAKKKVVSDVIDTDEDYAAIAANTGGDILEDIEDVGFFIDTGNLSINYGCSGRYIHGGIPGDKITEAYGPPASGKSLIASNCMRGAQNMGAWVIILDCENATNSDFMKKTSHLDTKKVVRYTPPSLERAFRQIHVSTTSIRKYEKEKGREQKPIFVVFDSLTVPPCERELRENDLPMDFSVTDWKTIVGRHEQPGERAKVIGTEMRKLQAMIAERGVTVYIINQVRDQIGVLYGSPEITPGGKAMGFYSSLRFRCSTRKKIEQKERETFSGINMQVKNTKNRSFRPFVEANDVKLYWEDGIDPTSGLLTCLIEGSRVSGKGTYSVAEAYLPEGRAEYKFKAKKSENRVPTQVLLDCPKLIDAESEAEVQEYLDRWGGGIMATESGEYGEKSVKFDADGNAYESENYDEYADDE